MRINVVKDEKGKVVATFENPAAGGPTIKPVLKAGHSVHQVEAPENYTANLKSFYQHHSQ